MITLSPNADDATSVIRGCLENMFLNREKHEDNTVQVINDKSYSTEKPIHYHALYAIGTLSSVGGYDPTEISYLDLYFENANGAEKILLEKLNDAKIVLVDGSEHLDRFPLLRDALRERATEFVAIVHLRV